MTDRDGNIIMNEAMWAAYQEMVASIPPTVHIMAIDEHGVMMEEGLKCQDCPKICHFQRVLQKGQPEKLCDHCWIIKTDKLIAAIKAELAWRDMEAQLAMRRKQRRMEGH